MASLPEFAISPADASARFDFARDLRTHGTPALYRAGDAGPGENVFVTVSARGLKPVDSRDGLRLLGGAPVGPFGQGGAYTVSCLRAYPSDASESNGTRVVVAAAGSLPEARGVVRLKEGDTFEVRGEAFGLAGTVRLVVATRITPNPCLWSASCSMRGAT